MIQYIQPAYRNELSGVGGQNGPEWKAVLINVQF